MRDKIFQKLKQEYSHLGLGKEVLQAQADALAATGIVTDENIDIIVSSQKAFLESVQKANDQRATDAQRKAKEDALKEYEAQKEKERKAAEDEAKRKELEKQMPDWYVKEKQASDDMLKKLAESNELLRKGLEAMQNENTAFKAEKAAAERKNLILSKAKELGIPEYRIKEGFSIAADADEAAITEHLTSVANNIKAFSLPSNKEAFPMSGPELKKEDLESIAKSLVV